MGISGRIAAAFQRAQITPLLALVAFLLGVFAVMVTPREEEPQINVTMANVIAPFPGASVREVEQMVAIPAEQVLSKIAGVEHVYSVSRPGVAILTVQFEVGVPRTEALVKLHDTIRENSDWLPQNLGLPEPLIKPKGIDDVPIVSLTLHGKNADVAAFDLERVAHSDALTGLANRAEFDRVQARLIETCRQSGGTFSLVLCDIDHFKQVNDVHGHQAGDEVLVEFAALLATR